LKKADTPLNYIDAFLKEKGYQNETLFLRAMERLEIAPVRSAERAFANIPSDPCVRGLSQPDGNHDDKMYTHFKPRMVVGANCWRKLPCVF